MSKNRILSFSVLLLLVMISGVLHASGGDEEDRNINEIVGAPVRTTSAQGTEYIIQPPSIDLIDSMENVSVVDGDRIAFDRNVIREFHDIPASPETNTDLQSGKNIAVTGHLSFFSLIRGSSTEGWFSFYLFRYDDRFDEIDPPVLVYNTTSYSSASSRLHIHDGMIFYLMSLESPDPSKNRIFVKTVNVTEWYNISSIPEARIDDEGFTSLNAEIASGDDATVVLWTSYENEPDRYSIFKDGNWGAPILVPVQGTVYWPVEVDLSGTRWIYLYLTTGDGRFINLTKTADGGKTWSPVKNVLFSNKGITSVSIIQAQDRFHMAVVHKTVREIGYSRSQNGESWQGIRTVAEYSINYRDPIQEASIAGDDAQIMIMYENLTGRISSIVSEDNGDTFSSPFRVSSYYSHHPSFHPGKRYYSFINGTDLEIRWFEASRTGFIRTTLISPLALRSWDRIGILYSGFNSGGRIDLRILSGRGGWQVYPASGYEDALSYPGGTIGDHDYSSVIDLTGSWTGVPDLEASVIMEIELERGGYDKPSLNRISIDYTTSFPMSEDFTEPAHLWSYDNMTLDDNGLTLSDSRYVGHLIIGPIRKEIKWPDVLGIDIDSVNDNIVLKSEILRDDRTPYKGFSLSDSRSMKDIDSPNYMKWADRSFQDLPDTIDEIYIHITLSTQVPGFLPAVTRVTLDYSRPPVMNSAVVDSNMIARGETATVSFDLFDREDPIQDLDIMMRSRLVGQTEWSDSMLSGVMFDDGLLLMKFITDYGTEVGEYRFSAYCMDSNGNTSMETELDFSVEVINNRPTPPQIFTDPPVLYHGTDLRVGIIQDGADLETPTEDLKYNIRFIKEGFTHKEVLNTSERSVSLGAGILRKGDVWNVEVRTWDGEEESAPSTLPVYVWNSGPGIGDPPENITISEDSNASSFDFSSWFQDLDGDFLDYEVTSSENITAVIESGDLRIVPAVNFHGEEIITLNATDGMDVESVDIRIIVTSVNDPPHIDAIPDRTVLEREWIFVGISSRDEADGDHVTVTSNIADLIPGVEEGVNYQISANGSFYLRPDNSMVGKYTVVVSAFDGMDRTNTTFNLTVINVNDPPGKPVIEIDEADMVIIGSRTITLRANCSDPDMLWGEERLSCEWSSDLAGDLGTGEVINVTLPPGEHVITLRIEDSEGLRNETFTRITVLADSGESGEPIRTISLLIILGIVFFLIGLIIGIAVLVFSRKGKERAKENEEKTEEPEGAKKEGDEEKSGSTDDNADKRESADEAEREGGDNDKEAS
ncbi:MAG: hypothetical protein ACMUIG_04235 [Thermoplasmatota archaeon]